jgi:hypothetical protein
MGWDERGDNEWVKKRMGPGGQMAIEGRMFGFWEPEDKFNVGELTERRPNWFCTCGSTSTRIAVAYL